MNRRNRAPALRPWASLSLEETEALLEALPLPALLLEVPPKDNHSLARVILANAAAAGLTAYTRLELMDLPLAALFPLEDKLLPAMEHARSGRGASHRKAILARRGGGRASVWIHFTPLENAGRGLMTLEPEAQHQQRLEEENHRQRIHRALENITHLPPPADLDAAISLALQIAQTLTGATLAAVYRAEGEQPALRRAAALGNAEKLPESLPVAELAALQVPALWVPGKRPLLEPHPLTALRSTASLYRAAQEKGLSYIASAPLSRAPTPGIGLLVIAGENSAPGSNVVAITHALALHLTATIQRHLLTAQLHTALRQNEHALAVYRAIQDNIQDGVILVSPELLILEINLGAEQMLGYASSEVTNERLENILVGAEAHLPALGAIRPHDFGSLNLYRRDGRAFLAQVRCLPLPGGEAQKPELWAILLHDQSRQEEYRLRTQQLEQRALLGEVMAVFAHEVRNPINNISTGLQLMALDLPAESPHTALIGRLQQDCDRLAELMKSVLAFARPKEYQFEAVEVAGLLQRLVDRWRPRLGRSQVNYRLDASPGLPAVSADPRALEQVLNNLIGNAVQALSPEEGGKGGMLTLRARLAPQDAEALGAAPLVEISVSDDGPGIPEEIRERIFEPFFTTKRNGTGLGLAITKQIVTAHRGSIQVISIPGGAAFIVHLPALSKDRP